jgi:hypothetical protein
MPLTIEQQRALAVAQAKRKRAEAEAGPNPNAPNPIITAQRQSQTQAMSQWAQQQEARKAAEARQAQERREAARSLGGGMDMMVGQDAAGNVRPGSVVDTDLGAGITGSPLSFGQGLAEGAANTANTVFAASTGLGNAALNVFDPNRQQSQPIRIQVPRNALLDDGGALQSMSGVVPRIAGQIAGPRVAIGKVTPGGGFGANAAKDAIAIGVGTPQDMPRISDMFPEGTPIADMLRTREGDNAFTAFGKNAAEDLLASTVAGGILKGGGMLLDAFGRPRASVQATTAPPVSRASPEVAEAPPQPAPFSAPAEPKASSFLQNNADRIVGGSVGGFLGGAGDAFAASGGDGNGGPDIVNPYTGAFAGMLLPRAAARGYRAAGSAIGGAGFNEAVSVRRVRNLLDAAGRSADEIIANDTALYGGAEGGKPSVLADQTQNAQNFSVGLSRQGGDAPELASQQAADLARTRTGRLFSDVEATTNINPATVTADLDAAIKQASEEISPAYEKLFADNAGVNSERLMQLADDPVVGPYVRRAIQASESLQTTAGQAPSNARIWDLVKRGLDRTIESQKRSGGQAAYELEKARGAIKDELDALMPEYKPLRDAADAPRMRDARKQGAKIAGGGLSVEKVRAIASKLTGKPLTALQMSAVEKIVLDIEKARGIDGLASERMREVLGAVFGQDAADKLVARIRADQTILKNAQRRDPDIGAVSSQAGMADRGIGELAADAFRAVRSPVEAALAALSRSGAYTQDQRNRIAQMLYGGATPENLARIYGPRPPRNPLNVEPPPTPQGPPTNALASSGVGRTVGGAVVGAGATGLAAEAQEQTPDTTAKIADNKGQTQAILADIAKIESDMRVYEGGDPLEMQKTLNRRSTDGSFIQEDGNVGPQTTAAIGRDKTAAMAALKEKRERLAQLELTGKELEQQAAFERTRPTEDQQAFRDYAPLLGGIAGAAAAKLARIGGTTVSKFTAKSAIKNANALLSNAPISPPKTVADRAAIRDRATSLNEFWQLGGSKTNVPFETKRDGTWIARPPKDVTPPAALFPDKFIGRKVGAADALIGGSATTEAVLAGQNAEMIKEKLVVAYETAKDDPSEKNLARVQELEDQYAQAKGLMMLGIGAGIGTGIGVMTSKYASKRANVPMAEQELAILRQYFASQKKPPVKAPPPVLKNALSNPPLPPSRPRRTQRPPNP